MIVAARSGDANGTSIRKRICIALVFPLLLSALPSLAAVAVDQASAPTQEPITPIPLPPAADARKLALGEQLFKDQRLSHDGTLSCIACHDVRTNGTQAVGRMVSKTGFNTLSVFNAALSFRLNWEGNIRTFEEQAESAFENPINLNTSTSEVLGKLKADPGITGQFREAYGADLDRASLLNALATYERSLLTPGSRFDRWLQGDAMALTDEEQHGYQLFKSLGCIACHQGVNIGGNLYERSGIFRPLAGPGPELLRVPSLRNVATRSAYFHDGSASRLDVAVRRMGAAQLNRTLSDQQIVAIVAFLGTLTGTYRGAPIVGVAP
jgi:cytochrome c peroxidase